MFADVIGGGRYTWDRATLMAPGTLRRDWREATYYSLW